MSSPVIWILMPGFVAIILFILRHREKLALSIGLLVSLTLAGLAWFNPIGDTVNLGIINLEISDSLPILGRQFVLTTQKAPVLISIYLGVAFWLGGAFGASTGGRFAFSCLLIASLMTAALAVEPFLYAALLIEMAAIVAVTMFAVPGQMIDRGSLRFLTIQTLSMPFILLTGWLLTGVETGPSDSVIIFHAIIFLALGFSMLLWIFPFHTWMPMISTTANQYIVAFTYYMFPLSVSLLGLGFLNQFTWLQEQSGVSIAIQLAGLLMVLAGGLGAAYQNHLGRMLAFGMMLEIGAGLLTIGVPGTAPGVFPLVGVFFASLLPRGLALGVWALGLTILAGADFTTPDSSKRLQMENMRGIGLRMPIASSAVILAQLSIVGFPLLAGFPARVILWQNLSASSPALAIAALLGSAGLLIAALRTLLVFVAESEWQGWVSREKWSKGLLLILGMLGLFLLGIFPQVILPQLAAMANVFTNFGQ